MSSGWGVPQVIAAGSGGGAAAEEQRVFTETFTVSAWHVTNKYFVLQKTPTFPAETEVTVLGGPDQFYGTDFQVTSADSGRRLTWAGLGLEPLVADGDVFQISYPISFPV